MAKETESKITTKDIEKVQILMITKNGQHFMAVSDDKILIDAIVTFCKFVKLKSDLFEQCQIKELIDEI